MHRRQAPVNTGNESGRRIKRRANRGASSSHAQQPQQPEPVQDLLFGYLFNNNVEEHERFMANFATRPICKAKSLDVTFFANEGFEIVPTLELAHLRGLAEKSCPYSEVMVRAFYHNMSYVNGDLMSRVCGVDILVTSPMWKALLGYDFDAVETIPYDGDDIRIPFEAFNRDEAVHEARRPGAHRAIISVGQLTVNARILFYVMTHILFPRAYNHSRVLEGDIPVMWAIRHGINVNWRHYICWMMYKAKQKDNAALPFAYLVQEILEYCNVPMDTEQMVSQKTWNVSFGQRLLEQCKISKGQNGVWQYTNVDEEVPDVGPVPLEVPDVGSVPLEVHDVEPDGGFSLRDVMKALNAEAKQRSKMEAKQKKRWKLENERWRWMQGRMKGLEDRLVQLQLGQGFEAAGVDDQEAPFPEEVEEEDAPSEEEA